MYDYIIVDATFLYFGCSNSVCLYRVNGIASWTLSHYSKGVPLATKATIAPISVFTLPTGKTANPYVNVLMTTVTFLVDVFWKLTLLQKLNNLVCIKWTFILPHATNWGGILCFTRQSFTLSGSLSRFCQRIISKTDAQIFLKFGGNKHTMCRSVKLC